jgi:flagellar protein FlbD
LSATGYRLDYMIQLTRLNNHTLAVNSDLIKFVEQAPDTVITLVSGEKIVVRESLPDVIDRMVEFRRAVLRDLPFSPAAWPLAPASPRRDTT